MSETSIEEAGHLVAQGRINVVTLKPGDLLVFTCDRLLSRDQTEALHSYLLANAPAGVKCAVLGGGFSVSAVAVEE